MGPSFDLHGVFHPIGDPIATPLVLASIPAEPVTRGPGRLQSQGFADSLADLTDVHLCECVGLMETKCTLHDCKRRDKHSLNHPRFNIYIMATLGCSTGVTNVSLEGRFQTEGETLPYLQLQSVTAVPRYIRKGVGIM